MKFPRIKDTDILYSILRHNMCISYYMKYTSVCKAWNELCNEDRTRKLIDEFVFVKLSLSDTQYNIRRWKLKFPCIKTKSAVLYKNKYLYNTDLSIFKGIHTLTMMCCTRITDLSPLKGIHTLNIQECNNITDLTPLKGIQCMNMSYCTGIVDLSPIKGVRYLNVIDCPQLTHDYVYKFMTQ